MSSANPVRVAQEKATLRRQAGSQQPQLRHQPDAGTLLRRYSFSAAGGSRTSRRIGRRRRGSGGGRRRVVGKRPSGVLSGLRKASPLPACSGRGRCSPQRQAGGTCRPRRPLHLRSLRGQTWSAPRSPCRIEPPPRFARSATRSLPPSDRSRGVGARHARHQGRGRIRAPHVRGAAVTVLVAHLRSCAVRAGRAPGGRGGGRPAAPGRRLNSPPERVIRLALAPHARISRAHAPRRRGARSRGLAPPRVR